jgi:uncharacterized membrane protein YfcA
MLSYSPWLIWLGLLTGAYGTLIGIGGGVILVPALLLLYTGATPDAITAISLAAVFLNSLSGTIAYFRQRRVDYQSGLLFAMATVPGTIMGAWATHLLPRDLFSLIFGIMLILLALFLQLKPRERKAPATSLPDGTARTLVDARGETFVYSYNRPLGIALSFGAGFVAGLLGIGGGVILVPVLIYLLYFPTHVATATSHFTLTFTALTGSLTHAVAGTYAYNWQVLPYLAIGIIPGAQLGAWLARKLQGIVIIRFLALALAFMGVRLLLLAF